MRKEETMYYSAVYRSPIGVFTLACDEEERLAGLWMEGQKYFLGGLSQEPVERGELAIFGRTKEWLDRYFAGEKPESSELPLAPVGSMFRQEVWKLLCEIPYGQVVTYGALAGKLAAKLGKASMSGQAVGGAVGHNPVSIIIPCHRVVGSDGTLTGYAGGLHKKFVLLTHEGVRLPEKLW